MSADHTTSHAVPWQVPDAHDMARMLGMPPWVPPPKRPRGRPRLYLECRTLMKYAKPMFTLDTTGTRYSKVRG